MNHWIRFAWAIVAVLPSAAAVCVGEAIAAPPPIAMVSPQEGAVFTTPAYPLLEIAPAASPPSVRKVEYFSGMERVATVTESPFSIKWRNLRPGNYTVFAKATYLDGTESSSLPVAFSVQTHPADAIPHQVWNSFAGALQSGSTNAALEQVVIHKRAAAAAKLANLGTSYGTFVSSLGLPQRVAVEDSYAEYGINRMVGGKLYLSFVYFAKDEDGVWRIAEF